MGDDFEMAGGGRGAWYPFADYVPKQQNRRSCRQTQTKYTFTVLQ